jgi:glycerophosphoryl diester phosphodiesterase
MISKLVSILFWLSLSLGFAQPQIVVIAHRGEHLHHPENTLPAFQAAIDAHADFIEVDVRTTSDGQLVVMHDRTVDRTTDGKGQVSAMTLAQIAQLDAGVKFSSQFTGVRVPRFEEVVKLSQGRIGIYVDAKQVDAEALLKMLDKYSMVPHVVVYGGAKLLTALHQLRPEIRVMPEAESLDLVHQEFEVLEPKVVAFDAHDFKDEIIAAVLKQKALIYVDRLGPADTPEMWQDAITRGASGIQTNRPEELVRYLQTKGYHK